MKYQVSNDTSLIQNFNEFVEQSWEELIQKFHKIQIGDTAYQYDQSLRDALTEM